MTIEQTSALDGESSCGAIGTDLDGLGDFLVSKSLFPCSTLVRLVPLIVQWHEIALKIKFQTNGSMETCPTLESIEIWPGL